MSGILVEAWKTEPILSDFEKKMNLKRIQATGLGPIIFQDTRT